MDNEALIRRWFREVWNEKRESVIDELLDADSVHHGLGGTQRAVIQGSGNFKDFYRAFLAAFPDLEIDVEDTFAAGDKVVFRCTVRGTHSGEGLGIAPTGKRIEITGIGICSVRDEKFVEVWNEFDFLNLYNQIGMLDFKSQ